MKKHKKKLNKVYCIDCYWHALAYGLRKIVGNAKANCYHVANFYKVDTPTKPENKILEENPETHLNKDNDCRHFIGYKIKQEHFEETEYKYLIDFWLFDENVAFLPYKRKVKKIASILQSEDKKYTQDVTNFIQKG